MRRAWILAFVCGVGTACRSGEEPVAEMPAEEAKPGPADKNAPRTANKADDGCRQHALPWSKPGCCETSDGLVPADVLEACGWDEYLGQTRDWGCAHTFRAGEKEHRLRVTSLAPLTLQQAIARHREGFGPETPAIELGTIPDLDGSEATAYGEDAWIFVPRGDAPLRLSWARAACSLEALTPIAVAMARSEPKDPGGSIAEVVADAKARSGSLPAKTLLSDYADRAPLYPSETTELTLPYKSKRMSIMLVIAASRVRLDILPHLMTPHARYGLPDRRELGAEPVFAGDQGRRFITRLRAALARFPSGARWVSTPMMKKAVDLVEAGKAPMWVHYQKDSDIVVLRLIATPQGARIDYVGFWPEGPIESLQTAGEPPPPPLAPKVDPS